jgi:hypothetical protein
VSCQVANPATACSDTTDTASISAGQTITMAATTSATSGSIRPHCAVLAR